MTKTAAIRLLSGVVYKREKEFAVLEPVKESTAFWILVGKIADEEAERCANDEGKSL